MYISPVDTPARIKTVPLRDFFESRSSMARKRRHHKKPNLGPEQIQRIQRGCTLSDFVKVEFEIAGAIFNEASLTSELLQLLQNVRLVERSVLEQGSVGSRPLGSCENSLPELLHRVQKTLNSQMTVDILLSSPWQQLHSLLGDRVLCKIFLKHHVYLSIGGSRWLQVTHWKPGYTQRYVPAKRWSPSEILVRRSILYSSGFAARAGLPWSSPLRKVKREEKNRREGETKGAKRLISWILSPEFRHVDAPPADPSVPTPQRPKRQRGGRKRKVVCDQERLVKPKTGEKSLQREVLYEALMEPVVYMLKKSDSNFQDLLSKYCPSKNALIIMKVFEHKNRRLGGQGLPSLCGMRCSCSGQIPLRKVIKTTRARSRNLFQCTGGPAEIRFMRDFPTLSCALTQRQVACFLCAAVSEVVSVELLGKNNWFRLVKSLKLLVHLRRYEELSVHDIMQGLSVKDFKDVMIHRFLSRQRETFFHKAPDLGPLKDNGVMAEVLGRLCYFIFTHLAVPLLRSHFYATEAEPGGMQTMYFRKNVWHFLRSRADCGFLHLCMKNEEKNEKASPAPEPRVLRVL